MLCRRPMLSLALAAALGVVAARHWAWTADVLPYGWLAVAGLSVWFALTPRPIPPPPAGIPGCYAALVLPAPGPLARRGLTRFVLIVSLACALAAASRQSHWARSVSPALLPDAAFFDATFAALAPQRDFPGQTGEWRVPARLLTVNGQACPPVSVSLTGGAANMDAPFRRGDIILGRVRSGTVHPPAFPGAFDFAFWIERDGLAGTAYLVRPRGAPRPGSGPGADSGVGPAETDSARPPGYSRRPSHSVVPVEDVSAWLRLRRGIDALRGRAVAATLAGGGEFGGLLAAMLFGYRQDIGDEVKDSFRRIGIGHVLAISGLHVGLIVGLLWWLAGWAGLAIRPRALACLALVIVYLGLSGGQTAAARATCMAAIHLASLACGRRSDMMNSLGAAAFLLIIHNPTAPLDISFQLSFTAVVFIYMALGSRPDPTLPAGRPNPRAASLSGAFLQSVSSLARLSFTTWAGLFPIIAAVFNQVNLIGLAVNIPAIPLMSLVLAGGLLLPWLAWIPGATEILTAPTRALVWLAGIADAVPYSSFAVHAPGPTWLAAFYFFIFLLLLRRMLQPSLLRRLWSIGAGAGLAVAVIGLVASMRSAPPPPAGSVTRLPGGGRGLIAVRTPDGRAALIGTFSRGGITGAEWLHHVRHGGGVAVVALGRTTRESLATLDWHFPLSDFTSSPVVDEAAVGPAVWREIPGVPGARYAVGRDEQGRARWIGAHILGGRRVFAGVR